MLASYKLILYGHLVASYEGYSHLLASYKLDFMVTWSLATNYDC